MRARFASITIASLLLLLLGACGGGGSVTGPAGGPGASAMEVVLTDHPIADDADSVMVTIDSVEAVHRSGSVHELLDAPMTMDLLELRGRHRSLGVRDVPAGTFDHVRLHIADGHIVVAGTTHPMELRSRDGVMPGPFEVPVSGVAVVVADFDIESSIDVEHTTPHRYHMDPVVRFGGIDFRDADDCPGPMDHHPAHMATDVPITTEIRISFPMAGMSMMPVDPSGILEVHRRDGPAVAGAAVAADGVVTFMPHEPLEPGTTYDVELHRGHMPGFRFCGEDRFSFTTRD